MSLPALSRRQSLRIEDEDREISVVDVLRAYDKAAEGVKTAREVMVSFSEKKKIKDYINLKSVADETCFFSSSRNGQSIG